MGDANAGPLTQREGELRRVLGEWIGTEIGPVVLLCAGMHGNEPAGIRAFRRVLAKLQELQPPMRGRMVALAGNMASMALHVRYQSQDLNRAWNDERIARVVSTPTTEITDPEERELQELIPHLREIFRSARGPVHFLDLHTTSAPGVPFTVLSDTIRNREFGMKLGVPVILGLEETLDGPLIDWVHRHGHISMAVEGGQHDDPVAVDHHEAIIWLGLVAAGCLRREDVPDHEALRRRLEDVTRGIPQIVEIRYRHGISPTDEYQTKPGFSNFSRVRKGDQIATDRRGSVAAREDGLVLLPLYQGLGNDGFFLGRPVRRFWMEVSRVMRAMRLGHLAHWLPGVRRHPELRDHLIINPAIARWFVYDIFHLLGYRKERPLGDQLVVSRRQHDLR